MKFLLRLLKLQGATIALPPDAPGLLAKLAERSMKLPCMVQESQVWVTAGAETVQVELTKLM